MVIIDTTFDYNDYFSLLTQHAEVSALPRFIRQSRLGEFIWKLKLLVSPALLIRDLHRL